MDQMDENRGTRLEYEAIVVAYAMSRLDQQYLQSRGVSTWKQAFSEASKVLGAPATSFKNLRDEFDPVHGNRRRGWHNRSLRPNRQRVLANLCELSDEAVMDFVDRIICGESDAIDEALDSIAHTSVAVSNVAERLRTGRLAEEYFLNHCMEIVSVPSSDIIDLRNAACGFDFSTRERREIAIETKGMKTAEGQITFTDREWSEANRRREAFWLIVVGGIDVRPCFKVYRDPSRLLSAKCRQQLTVAATWHTRVSLLT